MRCKGVIFHELGHSHWSVERAGSCIDVQEKLAHARLDGIEITSHGAECRRIYRPKSNISALHKELVRLKLDNVIRKIARDDDVQSCCNGILGRECKC